MAVVCLNETAAEKIKKTNEILMNRLNSFVSGLRGQVINCALTTQKRTGVQPVSKMTSNDINIRLANETKRMNSLCSLCQCQSIR